MRTMREYLNEALIEKHLGKLDEGSDGEKFSNEMDKLYISVGKDTKSLDLLISKMKRSKDADRGLASKMEAKFNAFKTIKEALFGLMDEVLMDIE